jgi:hypothetical protein
MAEIGGLQHQPIARNDGALETDFVETHQIVGFPFAQHARGRFGGEQAGRLGQCFDDQDPGHNGLLWKVPREKWFVVGYVLVRQQTLSGFADDYSIDQQKRVAMREVLLYLLNIQIHFLPLKESHERIENNSGHQRLKLACSFCSILLVMSMLSRANTTPSVNSRS